MTQLLITLISLVVELGGLNHALLQLMILMLFPGKSHFEHLVEMSLSVLASAQVVPIVDVVN